MLGLKLLTTLVVLRRGSNDFEQGYEGLGPGFIDIETLSGELIRVVFVAISAVAKVASSSASLDLNL